jgi:hypothetical protein
MLRILLAFAVGTVTPGIALAQTLGDISQFAQSICGDIPEGNLTRVSIQANVGAHAGLFAKLVAGNADVSATKAEEIYRGIPFDKLPDRIPTVSMCKSELVKLIWSAKSTQGMSAPGGIIQTGPGAIGTVINNK